MKKKTLKKWKGIVGIGFGLAVAAGLGVLYWKIPDNRPWQYVILEAGAPLHQPEDFLIKQAKAETSFVSDISSIDTKVPGDYTVELASGRFQYSSVPVSYTHLDVYKRQILLTAIQVDQPFLRMIGHGIDGKVTAS